MNLVNDLKNDFVLAIIVKKKHAEKINPTEFLPLLSKIREVLEPVSAKDHCRITSLPVIGEAVNSH